MKPSLVMSYFIALASGCCSATSHAVPIVFRNSAENSVYIRIGGHSCSHVIFHGTSLYVTLPADQQQLATGPTIQYESTCDVFYPPLINCQQYSTGFFGGVDIRARRGMLPDCGNTSAPAAMQMVLYGNTLVTGGDEFEYTSCSGCRANIERFIYPPYDWYQPYCNDNSCGTKPETVGIRFVTEGVVHLGWVRYVFMRTELGTNAIYPLAWSYCTNYNEPARVPCAADHNVDGVVDFLDYLDYVDDFAAGSPRAKFNMYGELSLFDYLDFLQAFTSGCN